MVLLQSTAHKKPGNGLQKLTKEVQYEKDF